MAKKVEKIEVPSWDYAPSLESTSHIELKERYDLYIDGKWVKPTSGKYFDTVNPANEP
jgi:aldehyde dehydrogenase (NAD+)